jgi:hypothetical protein
MADQIQNLDNSFNLPARKRGVDLGEVVLKGQKNALEPEAWERTPKKNG